MYHRQQAYPEHDLLYQEAVAIYGACGRQDGIIEEKPGEHAADEPQDKREIVHGHGAEAYLEDKPENADCNGRLDEGPQDAQIGADIPLLQVLFGQAPQKAFILPDGFDKIHKVFYIVHVKSFRLDIMLPPGEAW